MGTTSKPSVVETNVSQSAGSKASLAEVGLMACSRGEECGMMMMIDGFYSQNG